MDESVSDEQQATSDVGARQNADYVVVARRYRPQQFDELIGQEHVAGALAQAIESNRIGHAYLFTGARGVGKTSAARILAKALNCVDGPGRRSCSVCEICRDISSGDDVDVLEIDGASNRGIDEIRQLRSNVNIRPSRARFKIYIIDEVHMLTRDAFNALLKTLEEPPEHVKFIFCTTEPNKIPITVLSRCQRFDFAGIQTDSIERRLAQIVASEGLSAEADALAIIARRAAGSMRDSQSLLEQLLASCEGTLTAANVHAVLGTADDAQLSALLNCILQQDAAAALATLDQALAAAIDVGQLLEQLLGVLRDCMAAQVGCGDDQLLTVIGADQRQFIREAAQRVSLETTLAMLQILDHTLARFRVTTQRRTLAEMALVRLCRLGDLEEISALIGQLQSGEAPPRSAPAARRTIAPASPAMPIPKGGPVQPETAAPSMAPPATSPLEPKENFDRAVATRDNLAVSEPGKVPSERPPSEETAAESATPQPAQSFSLKEDNCQQLWQRTVAQLSGLLMDFAGQGNAAILAPNRLVVTFSQSYNKTLCEQPDNLAKIRKAMESVGAASVGLQFELVEAPAPTPTSRPERPRPSGGGASQNQRIFEAAEHPLVKKAAELFGARPYRVDDVR